MIKKPKNKKEEEITLVNTESGFTKDDYDEDDYDEDEYSDEMLDAISEKVGNWAQGYYQTEYFKKLPKDYREYADMIISAFTGD